MKRILIAEDNDSNFILMTYMLKGKYDYDRARNGQEAVEMANRIAYDLVIMDIKMPVMDGLEATSRIRAIHPDLPIVAITANVFDIDKDKAIKAGCTAFISKPINRDKCLDIFKKLTHE